MQSQSSQKRLITIMPHLYIAHIINTETVLVKYHTLSFIHKEFLAIQKNKEG